MTGSWRTSTVGVLQLVVLVVTALIGLLTGQQITPDEAQAIADAGQEVGVNFTPAIVTGVGVVVYGVLQLIGMTQAKDKKDGP